MKEELNNEVKSETRFFRRSMRKLLIEKHKLFLSICISSRLKADLIQYGFEMIESAYYFLQKNPTVSIDSAFFYAVGKWSK